MTLSDECPNKLSREQAIKVFFKATDRDDPYWENLMDDYYDEQTDTLPSIWDVGRALGFSDAEMERAEGLEPGRLKELQA